MLDIVLIVLAYVLGSISFGLLLTRLRGGVDLRQSGSGNTGATNVARTLGKGAGLLTLLGDSLKGLVAVLLAQSWGSAVAVTAAAAVAAVLGHLFPWYAQFRGGKGVATAVGAFAAILPLPLLGGFVVWIATVALCRYVSAGSMLAAIVVPLLAGLLAYPQPFIFAATLIGILVLIKHRSNLQRLLQGQESKLF
jgi:acyl phosphate:glycerol-3-phosphate acyltransferase